MSKKGMRVSPIRISLIPELFGRRLWKEVNRIRTYYFYSDDGLIGKYDSNGNEIKTYGHAPHSTWTTNPLFQKIGTNYFWYQNDHLGTSQKMTDSSGAVVWSATYDGFGEAQLHVVAMENNLRFLGQYRDKETGLHYNWNRYYDPKTGRYLTPDPIGLERGINLFAYLQNNPIIYLDPWVIENQKTHHCLCAITAAQGNKVASTAASWEGVPYKYTRKDRNGADCSGSVSRIFQEVGLGYVYESASSIANSNYYKETTSCRTGDVVDWPGKHMVIYAPKVGGVDYDGKPADSWGAVGDDVIVIRPDPKHPGKTKKVNLGNVPFGRASIPEIDRTKGKHTCYRRLTDCKNVK